MSSARNGSKQRWWLVFVAVAVLAIGALIVWRMNTDRRPAEKTASPEIVADFFSSLAALDVEESQLVATILSKAVEAEPDEPALWANLTVAHLRLRDLDKANQTLERAVALAGDVPEIIVLRAEALEQSGEVEPAIDALRRAHQLQPENIVASYALASLLGRLRSPDADKERLTLLTEIVARSPDNLRARCEQARSAATLEEANALDQALAALMRDEPNWPNDARQQLQEASAAATAGRFRDAARALTIFENLIKQLPSYQQNIAELGASETAVGSPLRRFLRLSMPKFETAEADLAMKFTSVSYAENAGRPDLLLALPNLGKSRTTLVSLVDSKLKVGDVAELTFPGESAEATVASVLAVDLNADFLRDLVLAGPEGYRIFVAQEDGSFEPYDQELPESGHAWRSVWTTDLEADGDLDLLLSDHESPLLCVRNNGDMTFTATDSLPDATHVVQLTSVDLDNDGDVDIAMLDAAGQPAVWLNDRSARYVAANALTDIRVAALAVGDVDRDGQFDLVTLSTDGKIERHSLGPDRAWNSSDLASWPQPVPGFDAPGGRARLEIADLDNNGALDLAATTGYQTAIWLGNSDGKWTALTGAPAMFVTSILDMNDDGLLDFVGLTEDEGVVATNLSNAGYGWVVIEPRAVAAAGDKRINSFGIGGRIEVRAGYLTQAAAIHTPRIHFGLGDFGAPDVARIVWPNGTVQAEFNLESNATVTAEQRLKGSCPWVFAYDGNEFRFVKDFIWRSPLGLRINAQDTAGVTQTEDWIKIPGTQLVAANGRYSIRITAELWETHFFDHVRLLAVDHPADVEVIVDERFVATEPQDQAIVVTTPLQPLATVVDDSGNSLDSELRESDGVYVDRFALGLYQGVAAEHWIEFELPEDTDPERQILLIGNGWVYPTDSSLNVAIAQSRSAPPMSLQLEQFDPAANQWLVVSSGLGFPAGKNKDAVFALPDEALRTSRRFRLRTNTETYWDSLGWAYRRTDVDLQVKPVATETAELRYRGYSKLVRPTERRLPDIPTYEVESTGQRWRDLEGYYTRFGDVRPLLEAVDDRYVIMNAGDEMVFEFVAPEDPPAGWRRDFVLVGDGWVKDGDFNTAFSQWVRPLPAHGVSDYAGPLVPLDRDPIRMQHSDDWQNYHTRYVTPHRFARGLWPPTYFHSTTESQP